MTEAITSNYDLLNTAQIGTEVIPAVAPVAETGMDKTSDFTLILDKQISNIQTLGDLKNTIKISDSTDKMADFKEFLAQATSEANVETSLDLTLARDINDIISQLKGAIDENSKADIMKNDDPEEITVSDNSEETSITTDITPEDKEEKKNIVKTMVEEAAPIVFEQVLTLADKFVDSEPTGFGKDLLNSAKTLLENNFENEIISKDIEEITIDTDLEQVDKVSDSADLNIDKDALKELNIESINTDTDTNDNSNFMNRQTPEEHSVKVIVGHNIEKFEIPSINTESVQTKAQANSADINPSRIIEQITKHLENMQGSKVNIVLNPQALGRINLQISNTQEGLTAQFTVSSNEVRDLLMKGLDGLKETLATHGVGVDNITVKLNETEKSSYNPDWTDQEGSRGGNKEGGQPKHQEKEKGLFEKTIAKTFKENGNV